jgi:Ser/Thr protein kinase RdoA (MazF antagonist)
MSVKTTTQSFYQLSVDQVFQVAESLGYQPTGEYFQLNSYENRVFDLFLEDEASSHIICKVYRPGRWSRESIEEEHQFLLELKEQGIPVIAPILKKKVSVFESNQMSFSFFPKAVGRMPQEFNDQDLKAIGRQLAKLHNIGAQKKAKHRPTLDIESMGWASLDFVEPWVAPEVWPRYEKAACEILNFLEDELDLSQLIRIHGDCHKGNILQTDPKEGVREFFFVDFDDFINGLPVQDFWMLFSGDETESSEELQSFLEGYEALRLFDDSQLRLMPAFRGLRIIYYAHWIAKRWEDPSFPKLFPEFQNYVYWAEEVEALEKIAWHL